MTPRSILIIDDDAQFRTLGARRTMINPITMEELLQAMEQELLDGPSDKGVGHKTPFA